MGHGISPSQALLKVPEHSQAFRIRRFLNWFPLGLTYAFLYWGRYNLTVAKTSLGDLMSNQDFGLIFGAGTAVYAVSFLFNGPLTDRVGGKRMMVLSAGGATVMNLTMGIVLHAILASEDPAKLPITAIFSVLYAVNMYFQSMGAVAIVKINASWFHIGERGGFSGIFGTMIASGLFFAFDVSERVARASAGIGPGGIDATWWVFYAPAIALGTMFAIELFLLKDRPGQAGHQDFDTGDASSGEDDKPVPTKELLKRILSHPVILTVAFIEFCTGVLRNGVMHWFPIYAKASAETGGLALDAEHFLRSHWGLLLMVAGIIGANTAGWVSDKLFQSRRGPAAGALYLVLAIATAGMFVTMKSPWALGAVVFVMSIAVIGTHGLLSGTATMDFGGRKGAATAVGVIDGFVYLGTAVQSVSLGFLTSESWSFWPPFLLPFGVVGFILCRRIWNARPAPRAQPAAAAAAASPAPAERTGTEG